MHSISERFQKFSPLVSGRAERPLGKASPRAFTQAEVSFAMHGEHELDCDPGPVAGGSPPAADGFDLRIEKTPAPGLVCPDVARETSGDRRWAPLVEASFADFKEAVEDGDTARSISLVKVLAELALIERSMIAAGSRRGLRALRLARLSLARRSITRHLSQASLSPAMVADLLGVSVRHMHMLFEGTGESFSQTVAAQRIRLSGRLLRETPARPISEVAHACGFESLATFYRVFHATWGYAPRRIQGARRSIRAHQRPFIRPPNIGFFDRQMTGSPLICAKTLRLFGLLARSQIDFGHFDPMFALNAALDRNAIP